MLQAQSDLHGPGFAELIGSPQLAAALHKLGVLAPSVMQAEAPAPAASGRDVLAAHRAHTWSGKTLTFVLPILGQDAKQQGQRRRKRLRDVFDRVAGPCR